MSSPGQWAASIMSVALMALTLMFVRKNHYRWAGVFIVFSFVSFLLAQFGGSGLGALWNGLTSEQLLCWGFAFLFLLVAVYFAHKGSLAYAFVILLMSIFCCFSGFSSVQALLKTHMLWLVTDSLKSYGEKIDNYQNTVADIQNRMSKRQTEFESNQTKLVIQINNYQKRLNEVQEQIGKAEHTVLTQQSEITNQFQKISSVQSGLATVQTNIYTQQEKLTNIESLVNVLFSNTQDEEFGGFDTNKVLILNLGGIQQVIFKLNFAPVPNTVQAIMSGGSILGQMPILPNMAQIRNILSTRFQNGMELRGAKFHFRYIKDIRETNLVQHITQLSTNVVFLDNLRWVIN